MFKVSSTFESGVFFSLYKKARIDLGLLSFLALSGEATTKSTLLTHLLHSFYRHICETAVTEQAFIEQLHELHHKIDFAKEQSFKGALSVNDVGNDLEKLKVKVLYHRSAIHFATGKLGIVYSVLDLDRLITSFKPYTIMSLLFHFCLRLQRPLFTGLLR